MQEARYFVTLREGSQAWVHAAKVTSNMQDADLEKRMIETLVKANTNVEALHFEELPIDEYTDALYYEYEITYRA